MCYFLTISPLILLSYTLINDDQLTVFEKAAQNFSFENVRLGVTLPEFKKMYRDAKYDESDLLMNGTVKATRLNGINASDATYIFIDSKLAVIIIIYNRNDIAKIGGVESIVNKMEEKYGKFIEGKAKGAFDDRERGKAFIWDFSKVNRYLELKRYSTDQVCVVGMDTSLFERLKRR